MNGGETLIITIVTVLVTSILGVTGYLLISTIADFKEQLGKLTTQFNEHNVLLTKVFQKLEINTERYNNVETKNEKLEEQIRMVEANYVNIVNQIDIIHKHIKGCRFNENI